MRAKIFMQCVGYGNTGARYRVTDATGAVLVERTRNPEFDGARALLARGVTGEAEVWRVDGAGPAMVIDIERAAKLTTTEGDTRGPTFVPWQPNQMADGDGEQPKPKEHAFPASAASQGRANVSRTVHGKGRSKRPLAERPELRTSALGERANKAGRLGAHTTTA